MNPLERLLRRLRDLFRRRYTVATGPVRYSNRVIFPVAYGSPRRPK